MQIPKIIHTVEKLISDNSPIILTAVGVIGTVSTAILTHRSATKTGHDITEDTARRVLMNEPELDKVAVVKLTWMNYLPPVTSGACTIAAIVFANKISMGRAAALAAAYTLNQDRFTEYKDKIGEKLGVKKEEAVRDEIAQDHVTKNPPDAQVVVVTGKVMCLDLPSDRYFYSDHESLRSLENDINLQIVEAGYAPLSELYAGLRIPDISFSSELGWTANKPLHLKFSTVFGPQNVPVLVINYDVENIRKGNENPY